MAKIYCGLAHARTEQPLSRLRGFTAPKLKQSIKAIKERGVAFPTPNFPARRFTGQVDLLWSYIKVPSNQFI